MLYDLLRIVLGLLVGLAAFGLLGWLYSLTKQQRIDSAMELAKWLGSLMASFGQRFETLVTAVASKTERPVDEVRNELQQLDLQPFKAIALEYGFSDNEAMEAFAGANPQYCYDWFIRQPRTRRAEKAMR